MTTRRTKSMRKNGKGVLHIVRQPKSSSVAALVALKAATEVVVSMVGSRARHQKLPDMGPRVFDGEDLLNDDYPVYYGYAYVVDGRVIASNVEGTVRRLRLALQADGGIANEIRRCNLAEREADYRARVDEFNRQQS